MSHPNSEGESTYAKTGLPKNWKRRNHAASRPKKNALFGNRFQNCTSSSANPAGRLEVVGFSAICSLSALFDHNTEPPLNQFWLRGVFEVQMMNAGIRAAGAYGPVRRKSAMAPVWSNMSGFDEITTSGAGKAAGAAGEAFKIQKDSRGLAALVPSGNW